jgi:ribulose kinase
MDFIGTDRPVCRRPQGLGSIVKREFEQVGGQPGKNGLIMTAGQPVGRGLTRRAAQDLGLVEGTPVGSAVIDAYAGWVGTIAAKSDADKSTGRLKLEESNHRLAACAGTSTCHIVQVSVGGSKVRAPESTVAKTLTRL